MIKEHLHSLFSHPLSSYILSDIPGAVISKSLGVDRTTLVCSEAVVPEQLAISDSAKYLLADGSDNGYSSTTATLTAGFRQAIYEQLER